MRFRMLALVPLPFLVGACDLSYGCTTEHRFAVSVTVLDAATGLPLPDASGVMERLSGWTTQPGDTIPLMAVGEAVLAGAGRPGHYAVRIARPGYATWEAPDVAVQDAGAPCHKVETVLLDAHLSRLRPSARPQHICNAFCAEHLLSYGTHASLGPCCAAHDPASSRRSDAAAAVALREH